MARRSVHELEEADLEHFACEVEARLPGVLVLHGLGERLAERPRPVEEDEAREAGLDLAREMLEVGFLEPAD